MEYQNLAVELGCGGPRAANQGMAECRPLGEPPLGTTPLAAERLNLSEP
ncbi:hypothetical protein FRAHR75_280014 [Frankia sp. Hr75.2]|nr:hypothetical protein FRAHR75_280014 [Frankia sp. Hr75.2]